MADAQAGDKFITVRLAAQADFTDDTLTQFTGWSFDGLAGRAYEIEVNLIYFLTTASDGFQISLSGSATFTDVRLSVEFLDWPSKAHVLLGQITAKDAPQGTNASDIANVWLRGSVLVNAAGTVTIKGACNQNTTGTCSVVAGSTFKYRLAQ
jgi:hypothetical protein